MYNIPYTLLSQEFFHQNAAWFDLTRTQAKLMLPIEKNEGEI
jgi:hypothetical protein